MSHIKIKFKKAGKWVDKPSDPVFCVEAGDEVSVTLELAHIAVTAGRADYVVDTSAAELAAKEAAGAVSFDTPAAGPIPKAEGKKPKKGKK